MFMFLFIFVKEMRGDGEVTFASDGTYPLGYALLGLGLKDTKIQTPDPVGRCAEGFSN